MVLKSQICALLHDYTKIDAELGQLRLGGKVLVVKLDSGTYGIVEKAHYIAQSK